MSKIIYNNYFNKSHYQKLYYDENKEKILNKKRKARLDNQLHYKFVNIINNAMKNDIKFNRKFKFDDYMTISYLNKLYNIQNGECFWLDCSCKLDTEANLNFRQPNTLCIGRLDKQLAFTKDNVYLCCFSCNQSNMNKYYNK